MVYEPFDTNGDGVADSWVADYDGDGHYEEIHSDLDRDGHIDFRRYDHNDNLYPERIEFDSNEDGIPEVSFVDTNENGIGDEFDSSSTGPTMGTPEWASYSPSTVSSNPVVINTGTDGMSFGAGAMIPADTNTHTINQTVAPQGYDYGPADI